MGRLVANRLNADRSDTRPSVACGCGARARYVDRREKTFTTVFGPMTLERAWYHCAGCDHGFGARDRALGFPGGSLSPAVRRMVGIAAAETSFGHASVLLRELAGLEVGAKQVERHGEAARPGHRARRTRGGRARAACGGHTVCRPRRHRRAGAQERNGGPNRQTARRRRQDPRGEAGHGLVGPALRPPRRAVSHAGSMSCNGAIESIASRDTDRAPSAFAARVLRELERRGFARAKRSRVVLGDGAAWIWNFADEHLPGAIQIVDLFHAKQHLFDVAKALYGPDTDLAAQWGKARRDELDRLGPAPVIGTLRSHANACDEARKGLDYFTANRERMAYPKFRALGLCVTTGVVEGACKSVIGNPPQARRHALERRRRQRHHRTAMCHRQHPNRFDDYWERQAAAS